MEILAIIISIFSLTALGYMFYRMNKATENKGEDKMLFEYIESLRKEIRDRDDKMQDRMAKGLEHSSATIQRQFTESSKLITSVTEKLTKLDETNKQVLGFSEQMQSLENILKNPKQRGVLGEYFLETLLSQVFQPNQYKMQYKFNNGEIVDAAIFVRDRIIPIDAKFSLEKYNMIMEEKDKDKREIYERELKVDIKNRIDETSKYIRPTEDTTDFAFMFIPAEGVYYNLLIYKVGSTGINAQDLVKYAFEKHVIIVSPTSFFAYLQTVLQGLESLKREESIKEIIKNVIDLGKHMHSYDVYLQKLGNNLGTTVNMYNSAYKEFKKIDKDIYKIADGESGGKIEALLVDKPNNEV